MRPPSSRPSQAGFTLVEVLIALAILSGSLILIATSLHGNIRRGVVSRERSAVELVAQSKFAECLIGAEKSSEGELPEFPRWRWDYRVAPVEIAKLKGMESLMFRVYRPDGESEIEWTQLRHGEPRPDEPEKKP